MLLLLFLVLSILLGLAALEMVVHRRGRARAALGKLLAAVFAHNKLFELALHIVCSTVKTVLAPNCCCFTDSLHKLPLVAIKRIRFLS